MEEAEVAGKVINPGPYIDGPRAKANVDTDGDGVPDGADGSPKNGSKNENWLKGDKDNLLFESLTKKWTK
jgi:hypothetical protein